MSSVADAWDEWDGQLAMRGVDPRTWSTSRMLNAAEQQIYDSAEDDKERAKLKTRLYARPRPARRTTRPAQSAPARGTVPRMPASSVEELLARVAAEDARFSS